MELLRPVHLCPAAALLPQELWEVIADLSAEGTDPDLLAALARGVGVHHSGLDTRYRQAVEMLFRSKHLQVGRGWLGRSKWQCLL